MVMSTANTKSFINKEQYGKKKRKKPKVKKKLKSKTTLAIRG